MRGRKRHADDAYQEFLCRPHMTEVVKIARDYHMGKVGARVALGLIREALGFESSDEDEGSGCVRRRNMALEAQFGPEAVRRRREPLPSAPLPVASADAAEATVGDAAGPTSGLRKN